MGDVVLVFRGCQQLFPGGVVAECFPVLFAGLDVIEAGHVHQVGHVGAGKDGGVEDGVEAKSLKDAYFVAFVEHPDLAVEQFFGGSFVAAQFVDR